MTSETLPSDLWASQLIDSHAPKQLLSILRSRLTKSEHFNHSFSDFLRARSALEHDYATSLQKLGAKYGASSRGSGVDLSVVGLDKGRGEEVVWGEFLAEVSQTASTHEAIASTLSREYETPVREMSNSIPSWRNISSFEQSVEKLVKNLENAESKVSKASKKGGNKLQSAQQDLTSTSSLVRNQLPQLVDQYQNLDFERLTRLKELAVKWETMQSDLGQKRMDASERGMMKTLAWEPEEEMRELPSKMGGRSGGGSGGGGLGGYGNGNGNRSDSIGGGMGTPSRMQSESVFVLPHPTSISPVHSLNLIHQLPPPSFASSDHSLSTSFLLLPQASVDQPSIPTPDHS